MMEVGGSSPSPRTIILVLETKYMNETVEKLDEVLIKLRAMSAKIEERQKKREVAIWVTVGILVICAVSFIAIVQLG